MGHLEREQKQKINYSNVPLVDKEQIWLRPRKINEAGKIYTGSALLTTL